MRSSPQTPHLLAQRKHPQVVQLPQFQVQRLCPCPCTHAHTTITMQYNGTPLWCELIFESRLHFWIEEFGEKKKRIQKGFSQVGCINGFEMMRNVGKCKAYFLPPHNISQEIIRFCEKTIALSFPIKSHHPWGSQPAIAQTSQTIPFRDIKFVSPLFYPHIPEYITKFPLFVINLH